MKRRRKGRKRKSSKAKPKRRRRTTRSSKRRSRRKHSFPKNPAKGTKKTITVNGRKVTFVATGKKGFGAWRITKST